ncbi:YceK/YidQ family lipoprotein [Sinimarinibacterium sp. CAU 1509]|uniref:YceK/YidQ family lipoprotein n=1 Tax=Sinimarinibacterium sp. CAU 1509 TaxID=2562283 RepID=UPI0010ACE303|nr:YceK/YidQ family lipoprotein [Sinimarinibacterium sp. CAU 1509]TJY58323.1 YceK/YidQ family lipoprotein [Sinimarinibacterium sp. CAU 1509]
MIRAMIVTLLAVGTTGCATGEVIHNYREGAPFFFAGTRLDLASLVEDEVQLEQFRKYGMDAPRYPLLDLPFSAATDAVISFPWLVTNNTSAFDGLSRSYKKAQK